MNRTFLMCSAFFALGLLVAWIFSALKSSAIGPLIDANEKCPYCGHRSGTLRYDDNTKVVLHTCGICQGKFAEQPVMDVDRWNKEAKAVPVPPPAVKP